MNGTVADSEVVLLAALLHDIGKFAQRAGRGLSAEAERLVGTYCPSTAGRSTHIHAAISAEFIGQGLGPRWERAEYVAGYHHRPESAPADYRRLALIVALADRLSSGERQARSDSETGRAQAEPLVSVFSQLRGSTDFTYFPLVALTDSFDGHTPLADKTVALGGSAAYPRLWEQFTADFRFGQSDDSGWLVDRLLALLEKYCLFIPAAAWRSEADISLYHHLKSTAAIAACLYHSGIGENELESLLGLSSRPPETSRPVAELVGCDISGIQSFIYNLRARGALKSLRGRSFYLQLLPEAVAGMVLGEFQLSRANLIYCGGGHFYALVPALADTAARLTAVQRRVDEILLRAHAGRLGIVLTALPLTIDDFSSVEFGRAWDRLHLRLAREKRRRFAELLAGNDPAAVLGPTGVGGEAPACAVCGEELPVGGTDGVCSGCAGFEQLGRDLSRAKAILEEPVSIPATGDDWAAVLAALGRCYRLLAGADDSRSAYLLNSLALGSTSARGFRFVASHVPAGRDGTATLEELAERAKGVDNWGVLRMDVDNLGDAFISGLGQQRSMSRLSMLSYLLGTFFAARVQAVARESEFNSSIYLAYSGGDDLFAVGPWSVLPVFARRINEEFSRFTSERLSLSAGIFIAPAVRFPVYEAAERAGDAEAEAKTAAGKNSISFLERVVSWSELAEAQSVKDRLVVQLEREKGLPRSILGVLRSSWQQWQETCDGRRPVFPVWRLLYALARLKARQRSNDELVLAINELEQSVVRDTGLHPRLDLIARWAELETRRNSE